MEQQKLLIALKKAAKEDRNTPIASATPTDIPTPIVTVTPTNTPTPIVTLAPTETPTPDQGLVMLPEYTVLYAENNDVIGWLTIEDTVIDYPVMQTPEDEEYYLRRDFYGKKNKNGCLFMDTDSVAGIGTEEYNYAGGTAPSTNLIIYGHTLKSGLMFGKLDNYKDKTYGMAHKIICFDTLYEKREYELMAVFYSEIFYQSQDVLKSINSFRLIPRKSLMIGITI